MAGIHLITAISESGKGEECLKVLHNYGAEMLLESSALGTATGDMLRLLGLSRTDKDMVFALCAAHQVQSAMTAVVGATRALTFSTALSSISVPLFRGEKGEGVEKREGVSPVNESTKFELVVVMANRGCIDLVMNAARSAGATGGTVIHARGNGSHGAEQFFGVTLADERDIFFIVTPADERLVIMQAIMREAGLLSPAKATVFSVPVQHLAGFPQFNNQ